VGSFSSVTKRIGRMITLGVPLKRRTVKSSTAKGGKPPRGTVAELL